MSAVIKTSFGADLKVGTYITLTRSGAENVCSRMFQVPFNEIVQKQWLATNYTVEDKKLYREKLKLQLEDCVRQLQNIYTQIVKIDADNMLYVNAIDPFRSVPVIARVTADEVDSASVGNDISSAMNKKYAGLPVWGWAAVGAGTVTMIVSWYMFRRK